MFAIVPGGILIFGCLIFTGDFYVTGLELENNVTNNDTSTQHILGNKTNKLFYTSDLTLSANNTTVNLSIEIGNDTHLTNQIDQKPRKTKVNKRKRHRKRRKNTTASPQDIHQTGKVENTQDIQQRPTHRRHRKSRRGKFKIPTSASILEVTTALSIRKNATPQDFSRNEIVQSLNKNPELNIQKLKKNRKKIKSKFSFNDNSTVNLFIDEDDNDISNIINGTAENNVSDGKTRRHKKLYNRCKKKNGGCSHICHRRGDTKCSCMSGFTLTADGKTCEDIDECKINNGGCQMSCLNNFGSYECRCAEGLRLAYDRKSCVDINECLLRNGHGPCQDTCINSFGSYKCSCENLDGTLASNDGKTCDDIDECLHDNGGCSHNCINVIGKYFCSCPEGWEMFTDWRTCQDINECDINNRPLFCNHTCINTEGSFQCLESDNMLSDQISRNVTYEPLSIPRNGYLNCSKEDYFTLYTKKNRKRLINTIGTSCKLMCSTGYKLVGEYEVNSSAEGQWSGIRTGKCKRSTTPTLECPSNQIFTTDNETRKVSVRFPPPKTNVNWKFVTSEPAWAKNLTTALGRGQYEIKFTAKHPKSKRVSSCSFKIIVELKQE